MAELLAIACSVGGIVSLGLEVCQGMIKYYQDWNAFDTALTGIENEIHDLLNSLRLLQDTFNQLSSSNLVALAHANSSLRACENALKDLQSRLQRCRNTPIPHSLKERVRALTQRSLYPLRKRSVQEIKASVVNLQATFRTAMTVLHTDLFVGVIQSIQCCTESSKEAASMARDTSANVLAMQVALAPALQILPKILQSNEDINTNIFATRANVESGLGMRELLLETLAHQQETTRLLNRLLERPSQLKAVCDSATSMFRQIAKKPKHCTCSRHASAPITSGRTRRIGPLSVTQIRHKDSCRFRNHVNQTWGIMMRLSCLSYLVQVSMTVSRGAGGLAICPLLRFRGVVREDSLTFAVVEDAFGRLDLKGLVTVEEARLTFADAFEQLRLIFDRREAHPTDITSTGRTLLHQVAIHAWTNGGILDVIIPFMLRLVDLGVPMNEVTSDGESMLDLMILFRRRLEEAEILFAAGACFGNPLAREELPSLSTPRQSDLVMDLAESIGCGSLSLALLSWSETRVARCLASNSNSVKEANYRGQTPLHISASWPTGIRILLAADADPNRDDFLGRYPIMYAVELPELESVQSLCNADSCIPMFWSHLEHLDGKKDEILRVLLPALVRQRGRLQKIALRSLPPEILSELEFSKGRVLDAHAQRTLNALLGFGIPVPSSVASSVWDVGSIYGSPFGIDSRQLELCYQFGFQDIDHPDNDGETPIMHVRKLSANKRPMSYQWFIEKGAHIERHTLKGQGLALHRIIVSLIEGCELQIPNSSNSCTCGTLDLLRFEKACRGLLGQLILKKTSDGCTCGCSVGGCTAVSALLKAISFISRSSTHCEEHVATVPTYQLAERQRKDMASSSQVLGKVFEGDAHTWWRISSSIIRYEVFTCLNLTHTCCVVAKADSDRLDLMCLASKADMNEIREEQQEALSDLEGVVTELMATQRELNISIGEVLMYHLDNHLKEYDQRKSTKRHRATWK